MPVHLLPAGARAEQRCSLRQQMSSHRPVTTNLAWPPAPCSRPWQPICQGGHEVW